MSEKTSKKSGKNVENEDSPHSSGTSTSGLASADLEKNAEMSAILEDTMKKLLESDSENHHLTESLRNVQAMLDERGWTNLFDVDETEAISLDQIQRASKLIRESIAGQSLLKRGVEIRNANIWGGGISFAQMSTGRRKTDRQPVELDLKYRKLMKRVGNQRYFFSHDARSELERCAYSDGNIFALADLNTKDLMRVPVGQISGDVRNPDNHEEIWLYRRTWNIRPMLGLPEDERVEWYYTDIYQGRKAKTVQFESRVEDINPDKIIIDKGFNRQVGWGYGVPDALPALAWAKLYTEFVVNGHIMTKALARFAFTAVSKTKKGGENVAEVASRPGEAGSTASMGEGIEFNPLSTAGKVYDFESGRPIAAMVASGVEVSLTALLSSAGQGGSYGSEQTLDGPSRASAELRRKSWEEFWERIFAFWGFDGDLVITWGSLEQEQVHRDMQALATAHSTGLFPGEVMQQAMAKRLHIPETGKVPVGYLVPNNRKSNEATAKPEQPSTTSGSGQGQSNPGGSSQDDHDDDE